MVGQNKLEQFSMKFFRLVKYLIVGLGALTLCGTL